MFAAFLEYCSLNVATLPEEPKQTEVSVDHRDTHTLLGESQFNCVIRASRVERGHSEICVSVLRRLLWTWIESQWRQTPQEESGSPAAPLDSLMD